MSTSLLPAMCLFPGKKKATLEQCAEVWAPCTIQVMLTENDKPRFVVGSGHGGYDSVLEVRHDQTGARMGTFRQIGEVHFDQEGKQILKMQLKGAVIPEAASVLVYK